MTNYEKIKNMNFLEFVEWINDNYKMNCELCGYKEEINCHSKCEFGFIKWLQSECDDI